MKKLYKIFLLTLLLCGIMTRQVSADNGSQEEIKVNVITDKENYQDGETVRVTVEVTNISDEKIGNVNISEVIPKGLKLVEGFEKDIEIGSIAAGETVDIKFDLEKDTVVSDSSLAPDEENTDISSDNRNEENVQGTDNKNNTVSTGDRSTANSWTIIASMALIVLIFVMMLRKKKGKELICLSLCVTMCTTMLNGLAVQAEESVDAKSVSVSTDIVVDDVTYELGTIVTYMSSEEYVVLLDPDVEEIAKITNDKTGIIEEDLSVGNPEDAVTGAQVSYTLKEGKGGVSISDVSKNTYFSFIPGAVGVPIDINAIGDEVETATITFKYDRSKLDDVNEDNLGICWYDEENNRVVLLENTEINKKNQTISVETTHFSQYIVIDTVQWYDAWAEEQLVVRDDSNGNEVPYYNIVFALDCSGSMDGDKMNLCREATIEFIKRLNIQDKISVMSFDDYAYVYLNNQIIGETTMTVIEQSVNQVSAWGNTDYQAGLSKALSLILEGRTQEDNSQDGISRQSLLIFLSDGTPTTNYTNETLEQLKYLAETVNCRCVTIGLGSDVQENYLKEMASAGNGEYMYVSDASQLSLLFGTINDWYVGSTKDSDQDGLPDIVETTGMRTEFGYFLMTDPDDADTDGDGINDGEEMGTFQYKPYGKSNFIINSNPTVPTYVSDKSKVSVNRIEVKTGKMSLNVQQSTFEEIYDWFKEYRILYSAKAEKLELASDFLSETKFADAQLSVEMIQNDKCIDTKKHIYNNPQITAGKEISFTKVNACGNNLLECKNNHNLKVISTSTTGDVTEKYVECIIENPQKKWEEILRIKWNSIENSYSTQESEFKETSKSLISELDETADIVIEEKIGNIKDCVEEHLSLQADIPQEVQDAFMKCYNNKIDLELTTNISSYENVKTAADLVNKITKELETSNGEFEFKVNKVTYVCEYNSISEWGASFITGTITNQTTHRSYVFGGTKINNTKIEEEMGYLKQFADLKIDEAKDAVFSDAGNILEVKKLKSFLGKIIKSEFFDFMDDYTPDLSNKIQKISDSIEEFKDLQNAYEGIGKLDLDGTEPEKIVNKVTVYNKALNTWVETVGKFRN